jgi:hypothetical protein
VDEAATTARSRRHALRRVPEIASLGPEGSTPLAPSLGPRFLGLEAQGARIAFVIDLSDSMLKPLTKEEVEDLKRIPGPERRGPVVTGADAGGAGGGPGKDDGRPPPPDLDWSKIRTRFDAAREFLKLSLRALDPEREEFVVIGFGSDARLFAATPGLRNANSKNVGRAIQELDAIEPGPPVSGRPDGTLWGYTNLHGGLKRALSLAGAKPGDDDAYVDGAVLERGCESVFLLSDGVPSWDDHAEWDTREEGDDVGDPESGAVVRERDRLHYYGPYAIQSWLSSDVERMNLFLKAPLLTVGLGEADPRLLQWLALRSGGQTRWIGAPEEPGK